MGGILYNSDMKKEGSGRVRKIVIISMLAALVVAACVFLILGSERYRNRSEADQKAQTEGGLSGSGGPEEAEAAPGETIFFASDYQAEPGFADPKETLTALVDSVRDDGKIITNVIYCGDYTNDEFLYDYQLGPDESIAEIRSIVSSGFPKASQDDIIFIQGNHDALTDAVSESGLHEYDSYLVYVLNTEYDFPWKQGRDPAFRDRVIAASEEMEKCFEELIESGETRPVFIAGHVPLHFTARTSSRHGSGDNMYSRYVFDAVNEAAKDLDIIYLFGHNHSKGWDCYLGGASVYKAAGDSILIPDAEDGAVNTDEYTVERLNFTYMNAGYTGYYMNCGSEELAAGEADGYHAADEALTCTVAEIYDDRIVITRYDTEGGHVLGAAGEADPYKGGIDEGLIGPEHYSKETTGPAVIKRKSTLKTFKNGKIRTDGTGGNGVSEDGKGKVTGTEDKDAA